MRIDNKPKIESVIFDYTGSEKQFSDFLRAVVREYLSEDKTKPEEKTNVSEKQTE